MNMIPIQLLQQRIFTELPAVAVRVKSGSSKAVLLFFWTLQSLNHEFVLSVLSVVSFSILFLAPISLYYPAPLSPAVARNGDKTFLTQPSKFWLALKNWFNKSKNEQVA